MPTPWVNRFLLSLFLVSIVGCAPVDHNKSLRNRQSAVGVVTGIRSRDSNGNVFLRREVRDLKDNHPDQWNLFLLALDWLQSTEQSDAYSFYGLASIHGKPYRTWGDAPGLPHKIGTVGYCPHNNQLFLGWHRPYLALYEQVLYWYVQQIAQSAPADQTARFQEAADSFRIPYWEWGQGEKGGPVPEFFTTPTSTVTWPDGTEQTIHNPLYSYQFHELIPGDFDDKWAYINETIRWPTSGESDASSQQSEFKRSYNNQQSNLISETAAVFRSSTFERFALLIEQPHGWIHGIVGGGWEGPRELRGHFWPLEYSAFDPLFILHHANVDRLFALYQAAHPDRFLEPFNVYENGNVFLENGQWADANTELLPFRKDSGRFWTTKDCWDHTVLGYSYPETQRWNYGSDEEYRAAIIAVISKLYGRPQPPPSDERASDGSHALFETNATSFTDWTIEAQASRSGLPSTFVVRFSLTADFSSDPSIDVGTWMILTPSDHDSKAHTANGAEGESEHTSMLQRTLKGSVSLTNHLSDQIAAKKLHSLDPKDVVTYLKDKLTWKVHSDDGHLIANSELGALTIEVFSSEARIPGDTKLPIEYSDDVTPHPEITMGKSGGAVA